MRSKTKIYTRTGDQGKTAIHGGERVDKDDIRIEANGSLDELNAAIGVVRAYLPEGHAWDPLLHHIQTYLMAIMSHVATPAQRRLENPNQLPEGLVAWCEQAIDAGYTELNETSHFILPGGNLLAAHCHLARTIARRAEIKLWTLNRQDPVTPAILQFVNRLSDLFFVLARLEMQRSELPENKWKLFAYKRKLTREPQD